MKYNKFVLIIVLITLLCSYTINVEAGYRVLQQGMEGRAVRELQENLVMLGYKIIIDGKFGPATKDSVIDFQKKSKLPSDGVVGLKTWKLLEESISFDKHKVKPGETLSQLATTYNVPINVIKEANKLKSNLIRVNQRLIIPKTALGGAIETDFYEIISYKVKKGDNLDKLASKFHTTIRTIKRLNHFRTSYLREGQLIKIPKLAIDLSRTSRNTSRVKRDFIWPFKMRNRISSSFGWRIHPITQKRSFHNGIDIAVKKGTAVRAIKSGRVLTSGWIRGFGKAITIDHGNGVISLYGHNSKLLVKAGQYVKQGQIISKSGNTGRSTGPHLHLTIFIDGDPVDPLKYLK